MQTLDDLSFLTSAEGERLLARLAEADLSPGNTLNLVTTLRKDYSLSHVNAALNLAKLRGKAVDKFGMAAARMFFTEAALQQASNLMVRRYRAATYKDDQVLDLCSGIGADALAFAEANARTVGVEYDPLRVAIARENARVLELDGHVDFRQADVRESDVYAHADVLAPDAGLTVFFDPARRDEKGRRIHDVTHYMPPLDTLGRYPADVKLAKLSPGVQHDQIADEPARVEFVSVMGDLKEAMLHYGAVSHDRLATLLHHDDEGSYVSYHWRDADVPVDIVHTGAPRRWLCEPDAALIRAGLVADAAAWFDGLMLDETVAYFTMDVCPQSPWVRGWEILDWMPFNLKHLKRYLRERGVGHVTVKKRGTAVTPDELIPKLKLKGDKSLTLVLTRYEGQQVAIVCADYNS